MKIQVRSERTRFSIAVPTSMAAWAVKRIPDSVFERARKKAGEPFARHMTKENLRLILAECGDVLKENKGLEVVHVEAADGTFVSIIL